MKNVREKIKVKSFRFLILPFCLLLCTSSELCPNARAGCAGKRRAVGDCGKTGDCHVVQHRIESLVHAGGRCIDGSLLSERDGGECS